MTINTLNGTELTSFMNMNVLLNVSGPLNKLAYKESYTNDTTETSYTYTEFTDYTAQKQWSYDTESSICEQTYIPNNIDVDGILERVTAIGNSSLVYIGEMVAPWDKLNNTFIVYNDTIARNGEHLYYFNS